jgi:hypothetical protein
MLGQNPHLYGFPELALFVADTVQGMLDFHAAHRTGLWTVADCSPGLLRAVAQLVFGAQTPAAVTAALAWVRARSAWTTREMFDFLLDRVRPRVGIDKSPLTALFPEFIARAGDCYPHARYLHLTRQPVLCQASMQQQFRRKLLSVYPDYGPAEVADFFARLWCNAQRAILDFTRRLAPEQTLRLRSEDLLEDPERQLAALARWLGVPADGAAVRAMLHPERSPYAHFGPGIARGANDTKFLTSPHLRRVAPPPRPAIPVEWGLGPTLRAEVLTLGAELGYRPAGRRIIRAA